LLSFQYTGAAAHPEDIRNSGRDGWEQAAYKGKIFVELSFIGSLILLP
jgi:hypothetical protein